MILLAMPVLLSLITYLNGVLPQSDWPRSAMMKRQVKICGPQINQALSLLCAAHASPHPEDKVPRKRSIGVANKHTALSMLSNVRYARMRRGGIVDECCYKRCSISELAAYCEVERINARAGLNF